VACAIFRIVEQDWSREDAIREMKDGGFGFHPLWKNIPRYLEKVDVAKIRRGVDAAEKRRRTKVLRRSRTGEVAG